MLRLLVDPGWGGLDDMVAILAKIFGELYFLLEYRDQRIGLQYSQTDFTLPTNLHFIGTMNTADRSTARLTQGSADPHRPQCGDCGVGGQVSCCIGSRIRSR